MEKKTQDWFEKLINDFLMQIIGGLALGQLPKAKDAIEQKLEGFTLYEVISKSPLVTVTAVDTETITFLVRGEFPFFSGAVSAFLRFEVKIAKKLISKQGTLNVDIKEYHTVIGDLTMSKEKLLDARLAFGYAEGSWMGRGALKLIPAELGMDIFLGGLDDRGAMIGLKVEIPVAIPLGSTGLGLKAIGGDFAYNFIARLEKLGQPIPSPTAADYVRWASSTAVDKWKPGPVDKTAIGVGIKCDIVTVVDNGRAIRLVDAGVAVLTPGPVFILGGKGVILLGVATAEGYLVVDIDSLSIAVGLGAAILVPPKKGTLVKGSGQVDALFSFSDPSLWYIYFGTTETPIEVKVLKDIFYAGIYYMVDNYLMQFGAAMAVGWVWGWWKIRLYAKIGVAVGAKIGWNPFLLGGYFKLWGEIGIELWIIKLVLSAYASAQGIVANPCELKFEVGFTIDLPWPIPDIEFSTDVSFSDKKLEPATIQMPLAEQPKQEAITLGAIHPITGRQWLLGKDKAWPDLEIVVPFRCQVIDKTAGGTVVGPAVSSTNQGGYDVRHELTTVTLKNIKTNKTVSVRGVWANTKKAETARLHLLGQDPYAWLAPHITPGTTVSGPSNQGGLIFFGYGSQETFQSERRFYETLIKPKTSADLLNTFYPALPMRVLSCNAFQLRFATTDGSPIHVKDVRLFVISAERNPAKVGYVIGDVASTVPLSVQKVKDLYGETFLGVVVLPISNSVDRVWLESASNAPLLVYGVFYVEDRQCVQASGPKQTLVPGVYELTVKGKSNATHKTLPPAKQVDWSFKQKFEVIYPERLRSYIHYTTLGDSRLFGKETHAWNPTTYGYGFTHYRGYYGVVRFLVPYISKIYTGKGITVRLQYDDRTTQPLEVEQTIKPTANTDKATSAQKVTQDWVAISNKSVSFVDEEVVFTQTLQKSGAVRVSLWYTPPKGVAFLLDEWTAHISRFENFQQHLTWSSIYLQTTYDSNGKTIRPVAKTLWVALSRKATARGRGAKLAKAASAGTIKATPLLGGAYPIESTASPFGAECTSVPAGWELPAALERWLKALDAETGIRFARFALDSGVRFDDGLPGSGEGPNQVVKDTTVEALVDVMGRPYALWLRTPEPVDWRRVKASMRIHHVTHIGGVPAGMAQRTPLDLEIAILPSPDASSAFLVGRFAGKYCVLPRGEYELTLTFDPYQTGLHRLRPGKVSVPESVTLKFMQSSGLDWPQPPSGAVAVGFKKPKALLMVFWVIPELLCRLEEGRLVPEDFERLYTALEALPDELATETLQRVLERSRAAYLRHSLEVPGRPIDQTALATQMQELLTDLQPVLDLVRALVAEGIEKGWIGHGQKPLTSQHV